MATSILAPSPEQLRDILAATRVIAMLGASPETRRPAFGIMRRLQQAGYRVVPVNPNHVGETLHGESVVASLAAAGPGIDLANVFRRSEALSGIVDEVIAAGVPVLWTQLGVRDEPSAARAEAAGIVVVMDRCISVEHRRLIG